MQVNDNALNDACLSGDIDTVKICLVAPRINITNNDNKPLISAVYGGHVDIVQLLLSDIRPDPSARNNRCIKIAIENSDLPMVKILMNDWRVSLDEMAYKLLYTITKDGHSELVSYITQHDQTLDINKLVMLSIIDNDISKFNELLPQADINIKDGVMLTMAYNLRRMQMVSRILADERLALQDSHLNLVLSLDVSVFTNMGHVYTYQQLPLIKLAIDKGLVEITHYLLHICKYINIEEVAKYACIKGKLDIFKMLYNAESNNYLSLACSNGHLDIVKFLCSYKDCNVSINNNEPLAMAVNKGHTDIVKFLLQDERLEITSEDECIDMAIGNNRLSMLMILLEDGRFNPSNNDNWALKLASERGYEDIVEVLLQDPRVILHM